MKIISWNVNGLKSILSKEDALPSLIKEEDPDILCLQETRCNRKSFNLLKHKLNYSFIKINICKTKKGYSGVLIASKIKPLSYFKGFYDVKEDEGRLITAEFQSFVLINVYVPNGERRIEFRKEWDNIMLNNVLAVRKKFNKDLYIVGDFNSLVRDNRMECNCGIIYKNNEIGRLNDLIKQSCLIDSYRKLNPEAYGYTWKAPKNGNLGARIDFCLSSKLPESCDILKLNGSDHLPLRMVIKK